MGGNMILALDASTTSTGYAIFDNGVLIDRGVIRPKGGDVKERIKYVYWAIRVLFEKYEYQYVFIEDVPLSHTVNRRVAENLLLLQGTIYSICIEHGCQFIQMEPTHWRKLAGIKAKRRDEQKAEAIQKADELYGFGYRYVDAKEDARTGDSDVCEAILIGIAGMKKFVEGAIV